MIFCGIYESTVDSNKFSLSFDSVLFILDRRQIVNGILDRKQ